VGETARRANRGAFEGRRFGLSPSSSRKGPAGAFRPKPIVGCQTASVDFAGAVIAGSLARRALALVAEWAVLHEAELAANWE
jgi:Domain of unknown function (DUF4160)